MKKFIRNFFTYFIKGLLILVIFLACQSSFAGQVSLPNLKKVAVNFFYENNLISEQEYLNSSSDILISNYIEYKKANITAFYVFNLRDNKGFVIISTEDQVIPILGYSLINSFDIQNLSPALVWLLDNYKIQITEVKKNNLKSASIKEHNLWMKYSQNKSSFIQNSNLKSATVGVIVGPLLGNEDNYNINFQQGETWNQFCPEIKGKNADVGCVAVAMAQIMKYWKYPAVGQGEHTYLLNSLPDLVWLRKITENFSLKPYNWSIMSPNTPDEYNALILYHCGVSVEMGYTSKGSGISDNQIVTSSLINYFKYSNTASLIKKDDHPNDWNDIIKNELLNKRPVFYGGGSIIGLNETPHAFVIDGFDSNNCFHINWGWGISDNIGYYSFDFLKIGYKDDNGKWVMTHDFNAKQHAVIGIKPNINISYQDLTIAEGTQKLSSATISAGSIITASCAEENSGTSTAGANHVTIWLSIDDILDQAKDIKLGEIPILPVGAGSKSTVNNKQIPIDANTKDGNYTVFFWADGNNVVEEHINDSHFNYNNFASVQLTVTSPTLIPPHNLVATAGNGQVSLSWSAPSSGTPTSYKVFQSVSENGEFSLVSSNITPLSKTITGLTNGTTYWYEIIAVYSTGESNPSNKDRATPTSGTVSYNPPRNLVVAAGNGQAFLAWSAPSSGTPTKYTIYKSTSENGTYSPVSPTTNSTSATVTSLSNGTTYWFYITAVYASGISDPSNKDSAIPAGSSGSNDDCSAAQLLTSSTLCNYLDNQTVNNATASGKPKGSCDNWAAPDLDDVWYYFKATATIQTITVDPNGSELDAVIVAYNSCSDNTQLNCSDITGGKGVISTLNLSGLTVGNYYYIRIYDYGTQTTNGGFRICVTGENIDTGDDFFIENATVPSTSIPANGTVSVSCEQCYEGNTPESQLGAVNLGYYLSTNSSYGSSDILLETDISGLGSDDSCNNESANLKIPGGTIPGAYYLLFVSDHDYQYDESSESNNVLAIRITVTESSHDFYTSNESVIPLKVLANGTIKVNYDFCYSGSALDAEIGSCKLGFYLSSDINFSSTSDIDIGSLTTGLGSDDPCSSSRSSSLIIPEGTTPGAYYVFLVADDDGRFVEIDENNNIKYLQITVVNNSFSEDIYIHNNSINLSSVVAGNPIDVTCNQCYLGTTPDANMLSSYVGYYLSVNASFDVTEDTYLGRDGSSLGSDYPCESENATLTIPSDVSPGSYYILFVADYDYRFSETNETNNVSNIPINIKSNCSAPSIPIVESIIDATCSVETGSVILSGLPATGTWTLTKSAGGETTTGTGTSKTISGLVAGSYTYTVTDASGCSSGSSANIIINEQPATPLVPILGNITHPTCTLSTGTVVLNGLPASGTWTLTKTPGGETMTGTGTSKTLSGLATGTYSYTVTNSSGCPSSGSVNVIIKEQLVIPTVPIVGIITQPTCVLPSGSVVLNGLPATAAWTLTKSPGGETTTGLGTSKTIAGLAGGTYTYTVTNAIGCTSAASADIVINPQPSPLAAPSLGQIINPTCAVATGSVLLNGLPSSGTWILTKSPGGETITGTGSSYTIAGLAAGTYTYSYTNASGCTSVPSAIVVIKDQPITPIAPIVGLITHPTCTLATGSVVLNGLPSTGTWIINPGSITGTGTSKTISGLAAGTYAFTVTNSSNCTSSTSADVVIIAPNLAPIVGSLTGNTTICQGQNNVIYTVPANKYATSYIWSLPIGATGTSTTNSITVNYGPTAVSGNIAVKGHNSCGDGAASILAISVSALPVSAGAITGNASVYKGTSETYTVPAIAGATTYVWTLSSGVTGTSTTNSITTTIGTSAASGTIKVKGHNDCGDGLESSLAITINDLSPGVITGASSVCKGTAETYSALPIAGATSYIWTLPAGATGSSSTNSISISFGTNSVSGSIKVKGHNSGGDGAEGTFAITVNDVPSASGSITGNTSVCQGGSESYTVSAINGATSYIWTLPTGATGTSATNSITVNYGTTAVSGNITVKGHNSCGDGTASTLAIIVNSKPATPVVSLNANVLHSNASAGNQWYDQYGSINGATNQDYTFTAIGNYSVIVTINGCASAPSALNVVTGKDPNESNPSIKVYPNPFTNELTIEFVGNTVKTEFVILNSKGQVVYSGNMFEKVVIQTSNFSTGLYFVKLNSGKTIEFKKIVKL